MTAKATAQGPGGATALAPRLGRVGVRLAVVAGVSVFAVYLGLWFGLIRSGGSDASDLTPFYTGWTIVADGRGALLYDPAVQAEVQRELLGGRTLEAGLAPFTNPPHLVLPFLPLTLAPLGVSYLVWGLLQAGLLAWLLYRLLTRVAMDWQAHERLLLLAGVLAMPPLLLTLLQGSFSLLLTVALTELYIAARAGRDRRAGAWLFAASLKPQAIVTLGVAALVARRRGLVLSAVGLGLASAAVATVMLGPGIWASYLQFLGQYLGTYDQLSVRPTVMWNLRGTVALLLGGSPSAADTSLINGIALAGQAGAMAATAWLWRRPAWWNPTDPGFDLRFSATIVLGLLSSPHTNPHDGLLLVPAAVVAYRALRERPNHALAATALFGAPFLILATNSLDANEVGGPPVRVPVALMVALLVSAVALLWNRRPAAEHRPNP